MDDRDGGFITLHRRLLDSPDLSGLRAAHLHVFTTILLLANWKPGHFWAGKVRIDVDRGELACSLQTIAESARASVREVRTTVDNLLARGVLEAKNDTQTDTRVRVLRVVNYRKYQDQSAQTDTANDKPATNDRHDTDTDRTRVTREQEKLGAKPAKDGARFTALTASLVAAFQSIRGCAYLHSGAKDAQAVKRLMAQADDAEILRRWKAALSEQGFHRCDSIAQFATSERWNHFARPAAERPFRLAPLGAPGARQ